MENLNPVSDVNPCK